MLEQVPFSFLRGMVVGLVIATILVVGYLDKENFNFDWFTYYSSFVIAAGMLAFAVVLEFIFEFDPDLAAKFFFMFVIVGQVVFLLTKLRTIAISFVGEDVVDEEESG